MCRNSAHNKMSELLNRNTDPLFEKMEKIFAERDAEYKKMEERNRVREEAVKEKENSLKKQEEQFSSREENVRQQEKEIEEKMQMLEERQRETQEMEKYLQKKRLELEADEQQSLLDNSILREEIRNEKLKQQRLSRELEDKLNDLGYSSDNFDPAILEEKEQKTKEQAQEIHAFIRSLIAEKYGKEIADNCSILYGGSCKPSNAKELFANPDVDGGLIGGAALKVSDFKGIIDAFN